jgi:Ni,Fe-hydrogenase I cytochrome b subunit
VTLPKTENKHKPQASDGVNKVQWIWGVALVLMGIGFFFRIPQLISKISGSDQTTLDQFFIRFCLYLMAVVLFGGGVKKLINALRAKRSKKV